MKTGTKIISAVGGLISLVFEVMSFAGYWFNIDVPSWIGHLPGVGHLLYSILYAFAWPWGRVMFPLLFLYLLAWNVALGHRDGWARIVGIGLSAMSLLFLLAFILIFIPLWSVVGIYHWLVVFAWLLLVAFIVYEIIWLSDRKTDKLFAYNYMSYTPPRISGLPIGDIVGEPLNRELKKSGRDSQKPSEGTTPQSPQSPMRKKPSLGRFYNKELNLDLRLYRERTTIGRSPDSDIIIDDPTVSRNHAVVIYSNGKFLLKDSNSANGTYINDQKIEEAVITNGDIVRFGQVSLEFQTPKRKEKQQQRPPSDPVRRKKEELKPEPAPLNTVPEAWLIGTNGEAFPIRAGKNTIGRQDDNSIVLNEVTVSRHHASITYEKGSFTIEDLGSSNGTFINGEKIGPGKHVISIGDRLRFGSTEFVLSSEKPSSKDIEKKSPSRSNRVGGKSNLHTMDAVPAYAKAFLVDAEGKHSHPLNNGETKIGRSLVNDITIDNITVSNHHAVIIEEDGKYAVKDLGSTNGTVVNGVKVEVRYLRSDDVIQFGDVKYVFKGEK